MTLPPTPDEKLGNLPFSDLMRVLLSQFKGLLAERGITLTVDETQVIAIAIADHSPHPKLTAIREAMKVLVKESIDLLQNRWGLTFVKSLYAEMDDIDNWDTTAEFIEIANEKSNAELRISAGSTFLVANGDLSFIPYLLDVIHHDAGVMDVDAVFAKRALTHVSNTDYDANDWLEQVERWLEQQ